MVKECVAPWPAHRLQGTGSPHSPSSNMWPSLSLVTTGSIKPAVSVGADTWYLGIVYTGGPAIDICWFFFSLLWFIIIYFLLFLYIYQWLFILFSYSRFLLLLFSPFLFSFYLPPCPAVHPPPWSTGQRALLLLCWPGFESWLRQSACSSPSCLASLSGCSINGYLGKLWGR